MKSRIKIFGVLVLIIIAAVVIVISRLPVTPVGGPVIPEDIVETEYAVVMMEGKKIGSVVHKREVKDGVVTTSEDTKMTIARMGMAITIGMVETSIESYEGKPMGFKAVQDMSGMTQTIVGQVDDEGNWKVVKTLNNQSQEQEFEWPEGALMAEGLRLLELENECVEGTSYTAKMFSPSMLSGFDATITIGGTADVDLLGRVVKLTEVKVVMQSPAGTMNVLTYVDDEMNALKTVMPMMGMNIEMISCDKEFALSDNDVVDFLDKMLIKSPADLSDIKGKSVTYYLNPKDGAELTIPAGDSQTVTKGADGQVIVTVKPLRASAEVKFPYKGDDPEILEALKPDQYIQCDDKEIKSLAAKAIDGAKDAATAAGRIESFVNGYIDTKDLSVGYASAVEVAASRQGDCTEHAVLTAALCRSVGIPARMAVGLVYVKEFGGKRDIFGGHAWAEAYIGGKWIGLDATVGAGGYGAGHITLATGNGDPKDFFGMVNTLGYFDIEKAVVK